MGKLRAMVPADCVGVTLRREDSLECRAAGHRDDAEALRLSLEASAAAIVWEVDGKPVAFAGLVRGALDETRPWLLTTDEARKHPLALHRMALRFLASCAAAGHTVLEQHVDADYRLALVWLRRLGFHVAPPQPWGPFGHPFCAVSWRAA